MNEKWMERMPKVLRIATIGTAVLVLLSTIVAMVFSGISAAAALDTGMDYEEMEALLAIISIIGHILVIAFYVIWILAILCSVAGILAITKSNESDPEQKNLTVGLTIIDALAAIAGFFALDGMRSLWDFSELMWMESVMGLEYGNFEPFRLDFMLERIQAMEIPYAIMRILLIIGMIVAIVSLIRQKKTDTPVQETKPDDLPVRPDLPDIPNSGE